MSGTDNKDLNFSLPDNIEEVPYQNNDGDIIQDSLKEIEKQTKNLQNEFFSFEDNNIISIEFGKNNGKQR